MTDTPSCPDCVFASLTPFETRCRRFPPVKGYNGWEWPKVVRNDWCGEFIPQGQPIPAPQPTSIQSPQPRQRNIEL